MGGADGERGMRSFQEQEGGEFLGAEGGEFSGAVGGEFSGAGGWGIFRR
jgi:hypothetical protein